MSGICGVWRKQDAGRTPATAAAMCAGLRLHRSEHARTLTDGGVGVGISARFPGQQVYESADCLVTCEADLYNEAELWKLIGASPREDAAVAEAIAGLYGRFGTSFLEKLRGDFSLILWDRRQRLLLAAIDGCAIHPLVYADDGRVLLVASRIDGIMATGEVARDIHTPALANYLNYSVNLAPRTIFSKVMRLLPGNFLLASESQTRTEKYWDMRYVVDTGASEEQLARKLEAVVEEAVAAHCKDDVFSGVGAYLSGGTDSSTVVGMMSRLKRGPVKTFSIGFQEERFNELEYARITAKAFQADHHEYLVSADDCREALPDMIRYFDEPFGNSSAIPTYFCARLASQHGVNTLLAGDGGDELFGGNERYLTNSIFDIYQRVPRVLRRGLVEPLLAAIPLRNSLFTKARGYVRRSNLPIFDRFFSYHMLIANPLGEIFEDSFVESLGNSSVLDIPAGYYHRGPATDPLDRLLYLDLKITLADNDLPKVTRMSELAGIQTRFPLLDRAVAEFSGTLPANLKVKGLEKRYLFKQAFRNLLPIEVIHKKKHGFGIPVAYWMKSDPQMREIAHDILLSPRTYQRGYIRRSFVEELMRHHETDVTPFYGDTLWTFLTLELWFRQFVDARVEAPSQVLT